MLLYLGTIRFLGESNIQKQRKTVFFLHAIRDFHLTFIFQSDRKDIVIAQSEVKSGADIILGCLFLLNDNIGIIDACSQQNTDRVAIDIPQCIPSAD